MEKTVHIVLNYMMSGAMALTTALALEHIAHDDFGFSSEEICIPALAAANAIAALVAVR